MTISKPSKEELEAKYKELGSSSKLGEYYDLGNTTASRWMKDYGIETNKSTNQISLEKKPSKEELKIKCKELEYNAVKVGEYYEVNQHTAWKWMKKEGIKTNKSTIQISQEKPSKEKFEVKYRELESTAKVGEYYKVNQVTALNWMKDYGIEINKSTRQISQEKRPSKEELEVKYRELGYNATKIGEYYDVSTSTALRWMKKGGTKMGKKPSKEELEIKCGGLGYNAVKVGEYYKVNKTTARKWMKDYGIKTRKNLDIKQALDGMLNDYIGGAK
jgi:hypothetical protein